MVASMLASHSFMLVFVLGEEETRREEKEKGGRREGEGEEGGACSMLHDG